MKKILVLLTIAALPLFSFAQSEKLYELKEIEWSFNPPSAFSLLDTTVYNIKISENITMWKRDLLFKDLSDIHSTIACSIAIGNTSQADWNSTRVTETQRSFASLSRNYPDLVFDSATTNLTIDGLNFQKFMLTGKENGQIKLYHIQLARFYRGYKVQFVYIFQKPETGALIEKQFIASKFIKTN